MLAEELNLRWHQEWRRQLIDAYCECRDVEVGNFVEIPLDDWERLKEVLMKAPSRTLPFVETVNEIMEDWRSLTVFAEHNGELK